MKITVKHKETTIIVDEAENKQVDRLCSIKFEAQQELVEKTLSSMVEKCIKIINSDNRN